MSKAPHKAGAKVAPRAWQRMLSGRRLDLLDPSPLDVEIEDIAHGLARVARWNGQTKGAHIFSVAQHALLVEALARAKAPRLDARGRLAVLLHDAPEYVIGDMISPFKAVIGDSYKAVEQRLLAAIHLRFGLPAKLPESAAQPDQGRRPRRRLSGSDAACRLRAGRGAQVFRPAAEILRRARARLSDALAGRHRRDALPRAVRKTAARLSAFHPAHVIDMTNESSSMMAAMIHVCSLARLYATVDETGARHIVTLLRLTDRVERPRAYRAGEPSGAQRRRHLHADRRLYRCPATSMSQRLIDFVGAWDRAAPMVVHCFAGISRSTAGAYVAACALNPARDEREIAWAIRRASRTAQPNARIVSIADRLLRRDGRMVQRDRDHRPRRGRHGRPPVPARYRVSAPLD